MQSDILEVKKTDALKAYEQADDKQKQLLKNLFGDSFCQKITDRVKTFEDACSVLGITPDDVLHSAHSDYLENDIDSINAYSKLIIIARALNEGWVPDWKNSNQYKYYPWFVFGGGSELVYDLYGSWSTGTDVSSRLCFKSRELAEYAGRQFTEIYAAFFLIR